MAADRSSVFRKEALERISSSEQVRIDCGVSRDGSTAKNVYLAAEHYGFDVSARPGAS